LKIQKVVSKPFTEIRSITSEYSAIYTDGSKDGDESSIDL